MKAIILDDMCSSTMTMNRTNLYTTLKYGVSKYNANKCRSLINYEYPTKLLSCFEYIGGFVDSAFFVKSEIDKLSNEDIELLIFHLSEAQKEWKKGLI